MSRASSSGFEFEAVHSGINHDMCVSAEEKSVSREGDWAGPYRQGRILISAGEGVLCTDKRVWRGMRETQIYRVSSCLVQAWVSSGVRCLATRRGFLTEPA